MTQISHRTIPRSTVLGAAALIGFSILAAGIGRFTGVGVVHVDYASRTQALAFRFEDRADGSIAVIAPETGATLGIVPAGSDGFIRTVLRSLAFDRQRRGVGAGPAFIIAQWSDGHATIDDPETGRRVDLAAFGAANRRSFETLIAMRGGRS